MLMKERFLNAVISGELGQTDEYGVTVTLKEFKMYFVEIESGYLNSFLPAAVIESGQHSVSSTKYVFRIKSGTYRVHPQAIAEYVKKINEKWLVFNSKFVHHSFDVIPGKCLNSKKIVQASAKGIRNEKYC